MFLDSNPGPLVLHAKSTTHWTTTQLEMTSEFGISCSVDNKAPESVGWVCISEKGGRRRFISTSEMFIIYSGVSNTRPAIILLIGICILEVKKSIFCHKNRYNASQIPPELIRFRDLGNFKISSCIKLVEI